MPARKNDFTDLGIDLPSGRRTDDSTVLMVRPGQFIVVDTGITFELPVFGRLRRWLTRLIFGVEATGIGGILKPRSRHNTLVMAGVVDPGYRGTIKVKVYNPNHYVVPFSRQDFVAQFVPVLSLDLKLVQNYTSSIDMNTKRGEAGGINIVRGD
jgi:dUTPase